MCVFRRSRVSLVASLSSIFWLRERVDALLGFPFRRVVGQPEAKTTVGTSWIIFTFIVWRGYLIFLVCTWHPHRRWRFALEKAVREAMEKQRATEILMEALCLSVPYDPAFVLEVHKDVLKSRLRCARLSFPSTPFEPAEAGSYYIHAHWPPVKPISVDALASCGLIMCSLPSGCCKAGTLVAFCLFWAHGSPVLHIGFDFQTSSTCTRPCRCRLCNLGECFLSK